MIPYLCVVACVTQKGIIQFFLKLLLMLLLLNIIIIAVVFVVVILIKSNIHYTPDSSKMRKRKGKEAFRHRILQRGLYIIFNSFFGGCAQVIE